MEIKHYAEGSMEPPLDKDGIYLYSMRFCPYAQRAHLVLNAKKVKYEPIYINLSSRPEWYLKKFAAGRVPALLYKNEFLRGSLLLADFINEEYPDPKLYPPEPIRKIKDRLLIEDFGKIGGTFYKNAMVEFNDENFNSLLNDLQEYEEELTTRGTKYFGGNERPLMIDYMIYPWFERFGALEIMYGNAATIPKDKFSKLLDWASLMTSNYAVQMHYLTPEQHAKHFTLRKANDSGAFDNVY